MKYFFSCLMLLTLSLSGCQSHKTAIEALSGDTFYAYSQGNNNYQESPFPLLPKDAQEHPYKYLHFQLQPKGNRLYVTYNKVENGQLTTHTKRFRGRWRKQDFRYQSRFLIFPLFPILLGWDIKRSYLKADEQQNIVTDEKGSSWYFFMGYGYVYEPYFGGYLFKKIENTDQSMVYFDKGHYGLRTNKDTLTAPIYNELDWFKNGVARARKEHSWGVIDSFGKEIIPPIYDYISYEEWEKLPFFLAQKDSLKGIFSLKGKQITPVEYKFLKYEWAPGMLLAQKDSLWGFIGSDGKEKLPIAYDSIQKNNYPSGYILTKGDKVGFFKYGDSHAWFVPAVYTRIVSSTIYKEYMAVYRGENLLFVDKKENEYDALPVKIRKINEILGNLDDAIEVEGSYYKPDLKSKRAISP